MPGTGLPTQADTGGLITQPTKMVDAAALSSASAWQSIADSGEKLASAAGRSIAMDAKLQQAGYLADFENKQRDFFIKLGDQYNGDPQGYENAARAHYDETIQNVPAWALPHAKSYVGGLVESGLGTQLNVKRAKDDQLAFQNLDARRKLADNDVMAVYSDPNATPEQQQAAVDAYDGVLKSMTSTRVLSDGAAQLYTEDLQTRASGALIRNDVQGVYQKEGIGPAIEHLNKRLDDLQLPFRVKDQIRRSTLGWLRSEDASFRGERDAATREWQAMRPQIATVDPQAAADLAQRAYSVGAAKVGDEITANLRALDINKQLRSLPESERLNIAKTGQFSGNDRQQAAYNFFLQKGWSPEQAAGIVGGLRGETENLNTTQSHDGGIGYGISGWNKDRLTALKQYAAARGKSESDLVTQLEFVDHELRTSEAGAGAALRAAQTPEQAGQAMLQYFRPADFNVPGAHPERAKYARQAFDAFAGANTNFDAAKADLNLTPQEQGLYQRHLTNLYGPGGVDSTGPNGEPQRSTLFQATVEHDGKFYLIPTVWDGKILDTNAAVEKVRATGWEKFPSYATADQAEARYQKIHAFMDRDTATYFARKSMATASPVDLTQSREGLLALKMLKGELGKTLDRDIASIEAANKKTEFPSVPDAEAIYQKAVALGTPEQQRRANEALAIAQTGGQFARMSPPERQDVLTANEKRMQSGATAYDRTLQDTLSTANKHIDDSYQKDPYGAAYHFNGQNVPALPSVDLTKPDAPAILAHKVAQQNQIRADQNLPAFSVFRPAEAQSFAAALTQGSPQAASQAMDLIAGLPRDIYAATLSDGPVKAALSGMVRSYDPAKLSTAMGALDRIWRDDPQFFTKTFDGDTLKRLQVWQTWKDSASAQEIAARFQRADDPAMHAAREALKKQAIAETTKMTPQDVSTSMGSSFGVTPGFIARGVTGSDPYAPTDGVQAQRLKAEFATVYQDLREYGVEPDQAKAQAAKRVGEAWGPSVITGNALMRYPPDRYYPAVDGSRDWMRTQVGELLAQSAPTKGSTTLTSALGAAAAGVDPDLGNLSPYSMKALVSDAQTEAEIKAGKPPSYQILVTNTDTGQDELFTLNGKTRFAFDPKEAQGQAASRFGRLHELDVRRQDMTDPDLARAPFGVGG